MHLKLYLCNKTEVLETKYASDTKSDHTFCAELHISE